MFGLSDGLVANVSLVLGVAGASPGARWFGWSGVAGLVAGAFSMAAGEYLSMTAQRELMERELDVERTSLGQSPEGEATSWGACTRSGASTPWSARDMVQRGDGGPELALETHAREELGINPDHLGSPVQSALSSFFTFALGAFIPLVPWLFTKGTARSWPRRCSVRVAAVSVGMVLASSPIGRSCARRSASWS